MGWAVVAAIAAVTTAKLPATTSTPGPDGALFALQESGVVQTVAQEIANFKRKDCTSLGWSVQPGRHDTNTQVCAASVVDGVCRNDNNLDHATASYVCARTGGRLCTVDEINADITATTGCGLNESLIWTADRCGNDNHSYMLTRGEFSESVQPVCMSQWVAHYNVRCCSDTMISTTMSPTSSPAGPGTVVGPTPAPSTMSGDSGVQLHFAHGGIPLSLEADVMIVNATVLVSSVDAVDLILKASFKESGVQLGFLQLIIPANTPMHVHPIHLPLRHNIEVGGTYRLLVYLTTDGTWDGKVVSVLVTGIRGTSPSTASPSVPVTTSPTTQPTETPSTRPTSLPTVKPTSRPTGTPTPSSTDTPTRQPSTAMPTATPTSIPLSTMSPTERPVATATPTPAPTANPSRFPSQSPSVPPTVSPTVAPTTPPTTSLPTFPPTASPITNPSFSPSVTPSSAPTRQRTSAPTLLSTTLLSAASTSPRPAVVTCYDKSPLCASWVEHCTAEISGNIPMNAYCPQTCSSCADIVDDDVEMSVCSDVEDYIDAQGFPCSAWMTYSCSNAAAIGYTKDEVWALLMNCAASCQVCEPTSTSVSLVATTIHTTSAIDSSPSESHSQNDNPNVYFIYLAACSLFLVVALVVIMIYMRRSKPEQLVSVFPAPPKAVAPLSPIYEQCESPSTKEIKGKSVAKEEVIYERAAPTPSRRQLLQELRTSDVLDAVYSRVLKEPPDLPPRTRTLVGREDSNVVSDHFAWDAIPLTFKEHGKEHAGPFRRPSRECNLSLPSGDGRSRGLVPAIITAPHCGEDSDESKQPKRQRSDASQGVHSNESNEPKLDDISQLQQNLLPRPSLLSNDQDCLRRPYLHTDISTLQSDFSCTDKRVQVLPPLVPEYMDIGALEAMMRHGRLGTRTVTQTSSNSNIFHNCGAQEKPLFSDWMDHALVERIRALKDQESTVTSDEEDGMVAMFESMGAK